MSVRLPGAALIPPPIPLPTKVSKLKREIRLLNQRLINEKKRCLEDLEFLKDDKELLLYRIRALVAENNLLRQRMADETSQNNTCLNAIDNGIQF